MKCKHKPQDPGWIISTEYGRYWAIDRVQHCKKCGARIKIAHKKRFCVFYFVLLFTATLCESLFFWISNVPLRVLSLTLFIGGILFLPRYIGNLALWHEVGMGERCANCDGHK